MPNNSANMQSTQQSSQTQQTSGPTIPTPDEYVAAMIGSAQAKVLLGQGKGKVGVPTIISILHLSPVIQKLGAASTAAIHNFLKTPASAVVISDSILVATGCVHHLQNPSQSVAWPGFVSLGPSALQAAGGGAYIVLNSAPPPAAGPFNEFLKSIPRKQALDVWELFWAVVGEATWEIIKEVYENGISYHDPYWYMLTHTYDDLVNEQDNASMMNEVDQYLQELTNSGGGGGGGYHRHDDPDTNQSDD
jgi:hypothetical protein